MDLDGTLLTNKKELPPYTRSVLKKGIDAGIEVVIASGRPYNGVPKELKEFEGIRYAVTSNGGRIVEIGTGAVSYTHLERSEKNFLDNC